MRTFAGDFKKSSALKDMSESCTASSLGIPQGGNAARVLGCSGAIQSARSLVRIRQEALKDRRKPILFLSLKTNSPRTTSHGSRALSKPAENMRFKVYFVCSVLILSMNLITFLDGAEELLTIATNSPGSAIQPPVFSS